MFGRQFRAAEHRQHVLPPSPSRYGFERLGSSPRNAGQCAKCDGMGRETYETDSGSLSTQTCTACEGTGQAKQSSRRQASWSDLGGGAWSYDFPGGPTIQITNTSWSTDDGASGAETTYEKNLWEARKYLTREGYDEFDVRDFTKAPFAGGPMDNILGPSRPWASRRQAKPSGSDYFLDFADWAYANGYDEMDADHLSLYIQEVGLPPRAEQKLRYEFSDLTGIMASSMDSRRNASSRRTASSLTWIYESPEQSLLGQEGWFANSGDGFHASIFEADDYIQLVPGAQRFDVDIYTDSNNYEHVSVNESGFESVDEAKSFVEGVFGYSRTASRKTSAVTWYDQSDQFGGLWSTYRGSAPDSPNGMINESGGMYRWYVSDSGTRGNQQTGEVSSLEEAKREAESALASLGITASRTASRKTSQVFTEWMAEAYPGKELLDFKRPEQSKILNEYIQEVGKGNEVWASHRTAFLDTLDLPEPRHRVAGWDWDDHLNGFIAAEAAREFTCSCGENVPAPGYTDCRCGKRWNAYNIRANGSQKMIAREVPVRENVVMARTARRKTAAGWSKGTHPDISDLSDEQLQDFIDNVQEAIDAGANVGEVMKNKRDRFEEELRSRGRKATRKIAAPSSGADAIAQHFPGWRVDDENGNFWEIQSPGGEHAFVHEEDGTYTVLTNDNTPDELWETGLSFEEALEEMRAEGVI